MEENVQKTILTAEGLKKYQDELEYLKGVKRKEIAQAIKEARAQGDLSENAEYQAAKEEQTHVEARIKELEELLVNVEVVDESSIDVSVVRLGSKVKFTDLKTKKDMEFVIVGSNEANIDEGTISNDSPIGHALLGAKKGEVVTAVTPRGEAQYKVKSISRK